MRRRRSRLGAVVASLLLGFASAVVPRVGGAQSGSGTEGAIFLLLPIGARSVALGEAVTARREAGEAVWWNPAGLGTATKREITLHHSTSFVGNDDAIALVVPSSLFGVFALSADLLDYGDSDATPPGGGPSLGTILTRSFVVAASYGTALGPATTGLTFKMVQFRVDCSGTCPGTGVFSATTYAVDFGLQYAIPHRPITLGAAVRNLGLPFQVNDAPQRDPIARRLQVGAEYRYAPRRFADSLELRLSVDVVDDINYRSPLPRFGAELGWQRRAFVRGGYVVPAPRSESGGPSIGLGYVTRALSIDLSRVLTGFSADAGQAPTYLSLRIQF